MSLALIIPDRKLDDLQQRLTQAELLDRISEAGREAVERDSLYNLVPA